MNNEEIIIELLELCQKLIELYEKYGLSAPAPILERLLEITRGFTKVKSDEEVKLNEQTTSENKAEN